MFALRLMLVLLAGISASVAAAAEPWAQVAPWGGQGEVQLTADATDGEIQIASLRDERDRLQWVAEAGGFPEVPAEMLDLGVVHPAVEVLRLRLTLSNDLPEALNWPAGSLEAQTYDFDVLQAVQRFQLRNGLEATGLLESSTRDRMNQPVGNWLSQIDQRLCQWTQARVVAGDQPQPQQGVVIFVAQTTTDPGCIAEVPASTSNAPANTVALLIGKH